ncbi:MAG TPA: shikimate kinase [Planctomycetaceae bacterium]|nr:shikimate kinase [Planctomycetaceae bacterium]
MMREDDRTLLPPPRRITLIGYRGTGKTTLARLLGQRLGLPVFDSDPLIERRAGKSIAAIFAEDGEAHFRDLEATIIAELLDGGPMILSPGGGAVLRASTRNRMREGSTVVWLTASPEVIDRRINGDATSAARRPSLTTFSPIEEIRAVLEARIPLYRATAHHAVDTDGRTPEEIAVRLVDLFNDRFPSQSS